MSDRARRLPLLAAALLACAGVARAAAPDILPLPQPPGEAVRPVVKVPAGLIALTHVRVIDGTGSPALENRTVLIEGAQIRAVQPRPRGYRPVRR